MFRNLVLLTILCVGPGCIAGAQTAPSGKTNPARILLVEMTVQGNQHRINRASVVGSSVPLKTSRAAGPATIHYELTDDADRVLDAGMIDDPRILRGVLPPAGEPQTGHPVFVLETADYLLRVPYTSGARFLKVSSQEGGAPAGNETRKMEVPAQILDLEPFLEHAQ